MGLTLLLNNKERNYEKMLLKLANRAFVRAVTQRPLTLTSRLSLSKIDADMVNYVEQQIGGEKERALSAIKGWSTVSVEGSLGVMTKEGTNGEKLTVRLNPNGTMPQRRNRTSWRRLERRS